MNYEKAIVSILLQAGRRGLPVRKIARHVHNEVNSLFEPSSYEQVYSDVRRTVANNARSKSPLFKHAAKYGYYRLNKYSDKFRKLYAADGV
ncbi:MAG: hypothetical protein LUI08_01920 [Prevotella sp.]|nr:hypothetical protein [Prevotella sp.]MCD8305814.1 hypothetical protein [Prevotella sp.]